MLKSNIFIVTLVAFITVSKVESYPAMSDSTSKKEEKPDSLFGLPFLEFKNGGVRVNFAGYHAEAGLGGLLGAPGTSGGLYAGAGTPSGAHASADLGGFLNGQRSTGGLLGARAGLGNGGPEVGAGLGGNLDGTDPSKSGGQLYAGNSVTGTTKISFGGSPVNRSNVQNVLKKDNPEDLIKNSKAKNDVNVNNNAEFKRREIDVNDANINVIDPALSTPIASDVSTYTYANRRCRRKRLCNNLRKVVIQQQLPFSQVPVNFAEDDRIVPPFAFNPEKVVDNVKLGGLDTANSGHKNTVIHPGPAPVVPNVAGLTPNVYGSGPTIGKPKPGTLFDDIFNIPISVLTAVNQLLNNKAG
ncbi:uncharacterized protein [Chelonus insularis]|uniref:uncharacterized protein n=1 Tax=Chelonus insularis TaxID=460826 RepID=UPI00158CDCDB|nr:uncharacterized protein LOC118065581 [Chelonus insularis]